MEFDDLLVLIAIVLVAARVGSEVAYRLKQPPVLGELIAGVIIGPSLLGLVTPNEALLLIAELGAVLLLFEIGLEHDLTDLFKVGRSAVLLTIAAVSLPLIGGTSAALAFGIEIVPALFLGGMLTATSIGITARVLADLGKMNTREARIIIGAAVLDDVIALMLMAVILGLVSGDGASGWDVARNIGLAVLFLVGSIVVGNLSAKKLLRWLHRLNSRGVLNVTAFVFCILMATGAHLVGLSPIIGAFAAGLVLARTDHVMHVREKIEASADLLIPIFFVMIGVSVEIKALNPFGGGDVSMLLLGAILIAVAMFAKAVSGFVVFGERVKRTVLGIGMMPRGEVLMTFAAVGLAAGVLDSTLYGCMVLLVLVSSLVAPPLLKITLADVQTVDTRPRSQTFQTGWIRAIKDEKKPGK